MQQWLLFHNSFFFLFLLFVAIVFSFLNDHSTPGDVVLSISVCCLYCTVLSLFLVCFCWLPWCLYTLADDDTGQNGWYFQWVSPNGSLRTLAWMSASRILQSGNEWWCRVFFLTQSWLKWYESWDLYHQYKSGEHYLIWLRSDVISL